MTDWADVPITGTTRLPPDPRVMKTIGLNHAFETAIADLADNSIDAGATHVLVRFVREGPSLLGICVVDDGRGMDAAAIDLAMTVGGQREYDPTDLGHFGLGLKAASLSQAKSVTVASRTSGKVVARRWLLAKASEGFECDLVQESFATSLLDHEWGFVTPVTGTVVRWAEVKQFPTSTKPSVVDRYLDDTIIRTRRHLGLVFHRFLEAARIVIAVDVEDRATGESGAPFVVDPINPFGYTRSGRNGYPKTFKCEWDGHEIAFTCHIWPGRSQLAGFKLPYRRPEDFQGFFFYRNDRLLQFGGWNNVVPPERHLQLARVEVNIDDSIEDLFSMNAEKTHVEPTSGFGEVVEAARAGRGASFERFLEDATSTFKESRRRTHERPRVIPPGRGFSPAVRRAVSRELDFLAGEEPLDIRWDDLADDVFFDVDRDQRVIWLNKHYRWAVLGERESSLNDAPLVKALLFLLAEELFRGAYLGAKDKDNLELWQAILTAAAQDEAR